MAAYLTLSFAWRTVLLLAIAAAGGALGVLLRVPMPWMLGALAATALAVALLQSGPLAGYRFPVPVRNGFVALIGVMIGTQVTPDLLRQLAALPLTVAGLALYVALAQAGNYAIFRRWGGFDRATAFYSATPGGLAESILMGERSGGNLAILTIQQFLRITLVVSLVPAGLSIWLGTPVGSAGGLSVAATGPVSAATLGLIVLVAGIGLWLGLTLRLPAGHILGPLLLCAGLTLGGWVDLHLPEWLIALAQLVVGMSLGLRFTGVTWALLRRSLGLSLASVSFMLVLGAIFAIVLAQITGIAFLHLFISFAPGGVAEMSIVALSLAANPALVSLHHVLRIILTVGGIPLAAKLARIETT